MIKNSNWQRFAKECKYDFPRLKDLDESHGDLISIGADLEAPTLIYAYSNAYFPMYVEDENENEVLGWFSPYKRGIFPLDGLKISHSMKQSAKKYDVKIDTNFEAVMRACMDMPRKGKWINEEFVKSYLHLHDLGFAHSVEAYDDLGQLAGGLYGVGFGGFFAGESMFSAKRDASKVALMHLVEHLKTRGALLLDAQWQTDHLQSLGAIEILRDEYADSLEEALRIPSITWS